MFIQIRESGAAPKAKETIADALVGCHDRVRHFTALAIKLAASQDAPADEVADVASRVYRYFTESLPLHQQDEDESLVPRLSPQMDEAGRSALRQMTAEHEQINHLVGCITTFANAIASNPATLRETSADLEAQAQALQKIWETHLPLEEECIFPQIERLLDAKTRATIQAEMQARRA